MTNFKNNIERINADHSIVYNGNVYVERLNERDAIATMLSDKKPGERRGYVTDGEYMAAINEPNGWMLDDHIQFDVYFNDYIKSHATLDELTETAAHELGIRPEDDSKWANDLRTVLREYILHYDKYLEDEDYLEEENFGNPDKLNEVFNGIIFDGLSMYVDIYDIAEDIRAFKPYASVTA